MRVTPPETMESWGCGFQQEGVMGHPQVRPTRLADGPIPP